MNIVIFEAEDWERAACEQLAFTHAVTFVGEPASVDARFAEAEVISTFIDSRLDAATLAGFPKLRLIATRSTGYDHVDLAYCRAHGISVCNVPDYGDPTVAEHAFALLLALARKIPDAVEHTRRGDFSQVGLRGFDLGGKTLGVVGTGQIGRRVIQIGKGFGMGVLAFDTRPDPVAAAEMGFRYVDFDTLIAECDVLTLHIPGGAATANLIGGEQFSRMKPTAVLVNTARGGVVDAEALIQALLTGQIAGAALDVLSQEPWLRDEAQIFRSATPPAPEGLRALVASHALLKLPNVMVTPHVAYDTREAVMRIMDVTLANIEAFAAGAPRNVVGA
jgi:D-lactate dehydrogenase